MSGRQLSQFVHHLRQSGRLRVPATGETNAFAQDTESVSTSQKRLWEVIDLPAGELADEAARFFEHERVTLQEMLQVEPLAESFSSRFLRDMLVFPYQAADGSAVLARCRSDRPGGAARRRDRAAARRRRSRSRQSKTSRSCSTAALAKTARKPRMRPAQLLPREDDIESLRDLASGAPVVRAVNDLLEKAVELRASDIHIEPFQTGLVVRMRIDGLLRPVAAPAGVLPQAVISRIKIIANLNIAERRLPQDGAARLRVGRADIDIRVAIMPMQHGESAVIRILPKDRGLLVVEKLGFSARRRSQAAAAAEAAARHDRRHRPDRQRQDHDAGNRAVDPERARPQDPDHRRPGRIRNPRRQPGAGQAGDRADLCRRAALLRAPGSRRDHGRRSPRHRNRACRGPCGADRASGADHAAYRNRRRPRCRACSISASRAICCVRRCGRWSRSGWSANYASAARRRSRLHDADFAEDPRLAALGFRCRRSRFTSRAVANAAAAPAIAAGWACSRFSN